MMAASSSAATHVGRRDNNEDNYLADGRLGLFLVADGVGGHEGGEVASALAVESLQRDLTPEGDAPREAQVLRRAIQRASAAIHEAREGALVQMGSTLTALWLLRDRALIGHIGDSRLYRLRDGQLECLTRDHSLVAELQAQGVPVGHAGPMAHILTRALGSERCDPDVELAHLAPGDCFLLCSDGLYEALDEARIVEVLQSWPVELAAEELVQLAYDAGSSDNITGVVVRIP